MNKKLTSRLCIACIIGMFFVMKKTLQYFIVFEIVENRVENAENLLIQCGKEC